MSELVFYDTLKRRKVTFVPLNSGNIRLYVCGPTVYDYAHIGNARPVVVFDVLYRLLKHIYPTVTYVRNITDVDDKINTRALESGRSIREITDQTAKVFQEDMREVGALPPDYEPRATEHIPSMIGMIEVLIEKGHAYAAEGHVLFSVPSMADYGELSGRNREQQIDGARVDVAPYKRDGADFVLWKPSGSDAPGWDSPWGYGRPGWHIECSAMSHMYLGEAFDIHAGGIDLVFPHHENEIAQSRCANDTKVFAKYWLHNAFITMSNEKMAKSQGNILKIKNFRNKVSGQVLRLALMSAHYKQPLDWNDKLLNDCQNPISKWYNVYSSDYHEEEVDDEILKPLYDDLNTPGYIANLHKLYEKAQKGNSTDKALFTSACNFIGLLNETEIEWLEFKKNKLSINEAEILDKIEQRNRARKDKNYKEADKIRDELLDKGVLIEDKDGKTTWKFK